MPRENAELLSRWFQALNARDIEGLLALCDPGGVFISSMAAVDGNVYHGHDGMRRYFADLADAWGEGWVRVETKAYFDVGEHTLAFNVAHARGTHSGAQVTMRQVAVTRWRAGLLAYIKGYADKHEALRDLAVSEDALEPIVPVTDSANVQLVRSIFEAWEHGDFGSSAWADAGIEFVIIDGPAPGTWQGLAGLADGFRGLVNAWEGYRVAAEEYRELDDGRVLVLLHPAGRGRTSGLELAQTRTQQANLFQIRDGKVTRLVLYLDRERALSDLGLAPQKRG
jgi:ketosteroid isomerase-like protein